MRWERVLQVSSDAAPVGRVMKPIISDGALKAAFVTIGGILVAISATLIAVPEQPVPHWVLVLAGAIGGLLSGKEALPQSGTIKVSQLPLEWRNSIAPEDRPTDPL